ncbi:unnamed protein product [Danaus chrysippus]|uniref:Late endosomal/lysosomal adaptor and MAPK and MTOR activator 5 n=1 Tax=Danaus chrysippus TaxID=151541 RepID=A0A8J2VT49_9NEOP|nr:unnamed protein product [Danaus chrysippus]
MEKELDKVVEEIMSTPNVNGCLVADHQGLCLASKGSAHVDSAETDNKICLIQRHGTITGAIFKQKGAA